MSQQIVQPIVSVGQKKSRVLLIVIIVLVFIVIASGVWGIVWWIADSKKATAVKIYGGGLSLHFQQIAFDTDDGVLKVDDVNAITVSSLGSPTLYGDLWVTMDGVGNKFFHTNAGTDEWILYEFKTSHRIKSITIKNRTDCCQVRLANYKIQLLRDNEPLGDAQQLTADQVNTITFA
jgi:hypothetical protein